MAKLKIEDLDKIADEVKGKMNIREGTGKAKITVHLGTCGIAAGGRTIMNTLLDEIEKRNVKDIIVTTSGCAGLCSKEPMMTVELTGQAPVKYIELNANKTKKIFAEHILGGKYVEEYAFAIGSERLL